MKNTVSFLSTIISLVALSIFLTLNAPQQAEGISGIKVSEGPKMLDSTKPVPNETRMNTFSFELTNLNEVCDELVYIGIEDFIVEPPGTAIWFGLSKSTTPPADPPSLGNDANYPFYFQDETSETIVVFIETGENSDGCDFRQCEMTLEICDFGPKEFGSCDWAQFDDLCESPTPKYVTIALEAQDLGQPTGTGRIFGKVYRNSNQILPVPAVVRVDGQTGCYVGQRDSDLELYEEHPTSTATGEVGCFDVSNLPYGTYILIPERLLQGGTGPSVQVTLPDPNTGDTVEVNLNF